MVSILNSISPPFFHDFSRERILVVGKIQQGYGDVSAVVKIAQILKKIVTEDRIAIALAPQYQGALGLFSQEIQNISVICAEDLFHPISMSYESEMKIAAFAPTKIIAFHSLRPLSLSSERGHIPTLCLEEYGVKIDPSHHREYDGTRVFRASLGLRSGSVDPRMGLGIFQSADLIDYYYDSRNLSSSYRVSFYLSKSSTSFLNALSSLDKRYEDPMQLDQIASIHFSYLSVIGRVHLLRAFIGASILLQQQRGNACKDMIVLCPGKGIKGSSLLCEEFSCFLRKYGFAEMKIIDTSSGSSVEMQHIEKAHSAPISRVLSIVTGVFSHDDFLLSLKMSEQETMATGDQSWTEQLVMGKKIYYQTMPHKMAVAQGLCQLISSMMGVRVGFSHPSVYDGAASTSKKISLMYDHFSSIQGEKWNDVVIEIHQRQNCEQKIIDALRLI